MQKGIAKHFGVVHPKKELVTSKDTIKFEGSVDTLLDQLYVMTVQEKECFPHFSRKENSLMVWIIMLANNEDTLPYRSETLKYNNTLFKSCRSDKPS